MPTLNLIYHLAPITNSNYIKHLNLLNYHAPLFNGTKIISISEGEGLDPIHPARLPSDFKVLTTQNDPELGEYKSWHPLINNLKTLGIPKINDENYTLYAHGKGVSREKLEDKDNPASSSRAIQNWTNMLYFLNFHESCIPKHLEALNTNNYLFSGAFKREGRTTSMPKYCDFYYQGNFFWVNTNHLLAANRQPTKSKFGIEAFPSRIAHTKNANNIFGLNAKSLYNYKLTYQLSKELENAMPEWKEYKHKAYELSK